MLGFILLPLAVSAAAGAGGHMVITDDRPTIRLGLTGHDLGQDDEILRIKRKIRQAASRVCVRGSDGSMYQERVACVKGAIGDGNRQLSNVLAQHRIGSPRVASIAAADSSK